MGVSSPASVEKAGIVKPDGVTIGVTSDGTIYNIAGGVFDRSFCVTYTAEQNDPAVEIAGNVAMYTKIMSDIERLNKPCECKITDGTDFAYLQPFDYTKRADGSASHLTDAVYFQGAQMPNFNIAFFFDDTTKKKQIWFNIDKVCPPGFHRFIKEETKLFGRYNTEVVAGKAVVTSGVKPANSKSLQTFVTAHNATNQALHELTYWEYCCLIWLSIAKLRTRNVQAVYQGLGNGSTYSQVINGLTDALGQHGQTTVDITKSDGTVVSSKPYKMWHMENPFHGDAWIICAGGITKVEEIYRYLYVCRDADVANDLNGVIKTNNVSKFDDRVAVLRNETDGYCLDSVGYWNVGSKKGGSSTTGTCDSNYGINTQGDNIIPLVGADSRFGSACGFFALYLDYGSTPSYSHLRGRAAMKR